MSAVWRAMFATLCFAVCAHAQTQTLAVYESSAARLDSAVVHELRVEVQRLLAPARIDVAWRAAGELRGTEEFARVAVVVFDGNCSVGEIGSATSFTSGILGDAAVGREKQVQPFFHVNCAQVVQTMRPLLSHLNVPMRNTVFGRALARVIAHEIYHIVAKTTAHAEKGVAKASFSLEDLISEDFEFDAASLQRLRPQRLLALNTESQ